MAKRPPDRHIDLFANFLDAKQRGDSDEVDAAGRAIEEFIGEAEQRLRAALGRPDEAPAAREALTAWLRGLQTYLRVVSPANLEGRYQGPLQFLVFALADLDYGVVDPILERAKVADGRSPHGIRAVSFKVRCVLAADEAYEARRLPGKKRPSDSRETVDKEIEAIVKSTAAAYGLSVGDGTIAQWRKEMRRAQPGEPMDVQAERWRYFLPHLRGQADVMGYLLGGITGPTWTD